MAVASEPDNTPLPGTVFTPRQVRVLKFAVIVMGILLVGGFAFVLAAIVYQASRGGQSSVASGVSPSLPSCLFPRMRASVRFPLTATGLLSNCSRAREGRSS